jgi:hypothetical protein
VSFCLILHSSLFSLNAEDHKKGSHQKRYSKNTTPRQCKQYRTVYPQWFGFVLK